MPHKAKKNFQYKGHQWNGLIDLQRLSLLDRHQRMVIKLTMQHAFSQDALNNSITYRLLVSGKSHPIKVTDDSTTTYLVNTHPNALTRMRLQCLFRAVLMDTYASLPEYEPLCLVVPAIKNRVFHPAVLIQATREHQMLTVHPYVYQLLGDLNNHPRLKKTHQKLIRDIDLCNTYTSTLFSVDIEAYEFDHSRVTEIGVSIADPAQTISNRESYLLNIHIIISENSHLRNGCRVDDNRDNYLFGNSLILPQQEARSLIQALATYYFCDRRPGGMDALFVSHGNSGDIKWLKGIGVKLPKHMKCIDTQTLFTYTHGNRLSSLGNILKGFSIPHAYLHNGGNDATFTLILLLKMTDPVFRTENKIDDPEASEWFQEIVKNHPGFVYNRTVEARTLCPLTWREALKIMFAS